MMVRVTLSHRGILSSGHVQGRVGTKVLGKQRVDVDVDVDGGVHARGTRYSPKSWLCIGEA